MKNYSILHNSLNLSRNDKHNCIVFLKEMQVI